MTENEGFPDETSSSFLNNLISEFISSPIIWCFLVLGVILLYIIYSLLKTSTDNSSSPAPQVPPVKKRDMTYQELKTYDGLNEEGQVCVSVNGKIFDVTGDKRFAAGGPYVSFAGRDATRCLANFSIEGAPDEYDDLSNLTPVQIDKVREWEIQFEEKYHYVGRLLKPGEEPTDYSDEEEASQDQSTLESLPSPLSSKKEE